MTPQAERFRQIVSGPDEEINLAEAALLIASEEYPDLDIAAYLARLDEMAATLKRRLRADISPADAIVALNRFLFDEHGFTGNAADYWGLKHALIVPAACYLTILAFGWFARRPLTASPH